MAPASMPGILVRAGSRELNNLNLSVPMILRTVFHWLLILLVIIIQFTLQACVSGGQKRVDHTFSFDTLRDSPEIEVLDYQYGNCDTKSPIVLCADREDVSRGRVFAGGSVSVIYPPPASLYVKWRIKETGQVYEDRVDLTKRLPADMTRYRIHLVVRGEQLYIFLLPPSSGWPVSLKNPISAGTSAYIRKYLIYPDNPKTFPDRIEE